MDESYPEGESQPRVERPSPKDDTAQKDEEPPIRPTIPNVSPSPIGQTHTEHCRPDQTPWWKHLMELAAILVGVAVAIIYYRELKAMNGQLTQMQLSGAQTDQMLCLIQQQLSELQKQGIDTHNLAEAAGKQANAALTQSQASLRSAKAQETANRIVSDQFHISQAAQVILSEVSAPTKLSTSFLFTNIGQTDAQNIIVQSRAIRYSDSSLVKDFDPVRALQEFRANPTSFADDMARADKEHEEGYRRVGMNEMADKLHAAAQSRHLQLSPKRVIPSIPHGGTFRETVDTSNVNAVIISGQGPQTPVNFFLILSDWNDVFGSHHSNDICYRFEGSDGNPCVAPVEK